MNHPKPLFAHLPQEVQDAMNAELSASTEFYKIVTRHLEPFGHTARSLILPNWEVRTRA